MHVVQGGSTGRLLSYSPQTGKTQEVVGGIFYANGVALSKDEDFVLLVESAALRVLRIWLKGPKVSTEDPSRVRIRLQQTLMALQSDSGGSVCLFVLHPLL